MSIHATRRSSILSRENIDLSRYAQGVILYQACTDNGQVTQLEHTDILKVVKHPTSNSLSSPTYRHQLFPSPYGSSFAGFGIGFLPPGYPYPPELSPSSYGLPKPLKQQLAWRRLLFPTETFIFFWGHVVSSCARNIIVARFNESFVCARKFRMK